MKIRNLVLGAVLLLSAELYSAQNVQYPELLVVPKASKRLQLEMQNNKKSLFDGYSMYIGSTTATLISGIYSFAEMPKDNSNSKIVASLTTAVGGLFTGLGCYLALLRNPYQDAYSSINKLPSKSTNNKLIRERLAEENIDRIASFNMRLRILTGIAQIAMGGAIAATVQNNYAAGITVVAGLFNMIFPHPSENVSSLQKSYKKKIYASITPAIVMNGAGLMANIRF